MLARWAKIMGPGRSRPAHAPPDILIPQRVLWDPSGQRQHQSRLQMFGAGIAPVPSFGTTESGATLDAQGQNMSPDSNPSILAPNGANTFAARLASAPPPITDVCQIPASDIHDAADANMPRVITSLRDKAHSQPGLHLDIIGILSTLAQRCEQAHQELISASPDGSWQNDVWFMCSKKILIARAKLEKWADIVAAGGVADQAKAGAKTSDGDMDVEMEDRGIHLTTSAAASNIAQPAALLQNDQLAAFQREIENIGQGPSVSESMYDPFMQGSVWTDDMFVPLDPSLWPTDVGDWSAQDTWNLF